MHTPDTLWPFWDKSASSVILELCLGCALLAIHDFISHWMSRFFPSNTYNKPKSTLLVSNYFHDISYAHVCIGQISLCYDFLRCAELSMWYWQLVTRPLFNQNVRSFWIYISPSIIAPTASDTLMSSSSPSALSKHSSMFTNWPWLFMILSCFHFQRFWFMRQWESFPSAVEAQLFLSIFFLKSGTLRVLLSTLCRLRPQRRWLLKRAAKKFFRKVSDCYSVLTFSRFLASKRTSGTLLPFLILSGCVLIWTSQILSVTHKELLWVSAISDHSVFSVTHWGLRSPLWQIGL